jgi:hypothetical protein
MKVSIKNDRGDLGAIEIYGRYSAREIDAAARALQLYCDEPSLQDVPFEALLKLARAVQSK